MGRKLPDLSGPWAIDRRAFASLRDRAARIGLGWDLDAENPAGIDDPGYQLDGGLAVIDICGVLTKYPSCFDSWLGLCPALPIVDALAAAAADSRAQAIALRIDSPGGQVPGTTILAEAVAAAGKSKTVYALGSDQMLSGGYWIASQASIVASNQSGMIGSVGVYSVLVDSTAAAGDAGLKLQLVNTGPYKGLGADGKVTDSLVADVQREIDGLFQIFVAAVAQGRGMTIAAVHALADGRSFIAGDALAKGLIDVIGAPDRLTGAIRSRLSDNAASPPAAPDFSSSGRSTKMGTSSKATGPAKRALTNDEWRRLKGETAQAAADAEKEWEAMNVTQRCEYGNDKGHFIATRRAEAAQKV